MEEEKELLSTLLLELRRGTLTISVLSQMKEPKYGYALVQSLEQKGVAIDPNTLYPLLRRLESQGLLESKWETGGAKPRKYYQRTEYGKQIYKQLKTYWENLSAGIEKLLMEEET
ncbi:PadR family transcriptional regulator [Zongyangia sp. HA2173]|jgi:PadR family transcriptional regulator PadR|uniref:PadR family transcriptional regulator n=1 Tax=Zongyangia sp. HA2173 TaxID=3133035 RepID=UPI0031626867